jgi:radical SAM superfamily enzyme YgiQ (UPF0313 family)
MSKVLLIKPRFLELEFQVITHPMGLMYIGAVLKKAGHDIRIHDGALDYGDLHLLRSEIKDWNPDFIGISIIITEIEQTKKIMKIIREIMPNVPVIFGGPWPSANPEESIRAFGADFVVLGEGEVVFPELIDAINKNLSTDSIAGTASMVKDDLKINPEYYMTEQELDALPFPAWELLDRRLYENKPSFAGVGCRSYMTIITSRGCPFKCAYCHQTMGKIFRRRSAQSVLNEIEHLFVHYGFKEIEIADDCFNLDRERMRVILEGIRDRFGKIKLHFPNGIRADVLEQEDLILFKQAGTISAVFAIETSSSRLQKMIHKNLNIEKAAIAIMASVKAGIYSSGYFMLGFPTETYEEASSTVEFAVRSPLHRAFFFNPIPFAGTELAQMSADGLKNKNAILAPWKINYYDSVLNISAMSDGELKKIFRQAYRRFYLNFRRILKLMMNHPDIFSLPHYAFLAIIKTLPRRRRSV